MRLCVAPQTFTKYSRLLEMIVEAECLYQGLRTAATGRNECETHNRGMPTVVDASKDGAISGVHSIESRRWRPSTLLTVTDADEKGSVYSAPQHGLLETASRGTLCQTGCVIGHMASDCRYM